MGVGDAQPDALEPPSPQRAEELAPEGLGLRLADIDADDLPPAGLVDAVGDHQGLLTNPTGLADPFHFGVQPQVGIAALQRPLAEHRTCSSRPRHNLDT